MESNVNQNRSIELKIGISNNVQRASLGMLLICGLLIIFGKLSMVEFGFASLSGLLFIVSIFIGNEAINRIADESKEGVWMDLDKKGFNSQAIISILGLAGLFFALVCFASKNWS